MLLAGKPRFVRRKRCPRVLEGKPFDEKDREALLEIVALHKALLRSEDRFPDNDLDQPRLLFFFRIIVDVEARGIVVLLGDADDEIPVSPPVEDLDHAGLLQHAHDLPFVVHAQELVGCEEIFLLE